MQNNSWSDPALLAARLLIAGLFLGGAAQKLASPSDAQALLAMQGLPAALIWPAFLFNLTAGLMLVLGVRVRLVALLLAVYCGATSFFHLIPADPWQMSIFVKNWAISGGCLALAVAGSGRWALSPDIQGQTDPANAPRLPH
ncbi:DoxX family protein [Roseinatronobacter sp.]